MKNRKYLCTCSFVFLGVALSIVPYREVQPADADGNKTPHEQKHGHNGEINEKKIKATPKYSVQAACSASIAL